MPATPGARDVARPTERHEVPEAMLVFVLLGAAAFASAVLHDTLGRPDGTASWYALALRRPVELFTVAWCGLVWLPVALGTCGLPLARPWREAARVVAVAALPAVVLVTVARLELAAPLARAAEGAPLVVWPHALDASLVGAVALLTAVARRSLAGRGGLELARPADA